MVLAFRLSIAGRTQLLSSTAKPSARPLEILDRRDLPDPLAIASAPTLSCATGGTTDAALPSGPTEAGPATRPCSRSVRVGSDVVGLRHRFTAVCTGSRS